MIFSLLKRSARSLVFLLGLTGLTGAFSGLSDASLAQAQQNYQDYSRRRPVSQSYAFNAPKNTLTTAPKADPLTFEAFSVPNIANPLFLPTGFQEIKKTGAIMAFEKDQTMIEVVILEENCAPEGYGRSACLEKGHQESVKAIQQQNTHTLTENRFLFFPAQVDYHFSRSKNKLFGRFFRAEGQNSLGQITFLKENDPNVYAVRISEPKRNSSEKSHQFLNKYAVAHQKLVQSLQGVVQDAVFTKNKRKKAQKTAPQTPERRPPRRATQKNQAIGFFGAQKDSFTKFVSKNGAWAVHLPKSFETLSEDLTTKNGEWTLVSADGFARLERVLGTCEGGLKARRSCLTIKSDAQIQAHAKKKGVQLFSGPESFLLPLIAEEPYGTRAIRMAHFKTEDGFEEIVGFFITPEGEMWRWRVVEPTEKKTALKDALQTKKSLRGVRFTPKKVSFSSFESLPFSF